MSAPAPERGLLDVDSVVVPTAAVEMAHAHLRRVGEDGAEGFALWAGVLEGNTFHVRETVIPRQTAHATPDGVYVAVDEAEMRRIGRWLFENGLRLAAQLHSHPGAAYHSDTDDALPIVATEGALSIVVPNFAREPFDLAGCATYRLIPRRGWIAVTPAAARRLFTVVGAPDAAAEPERKLTTEGGGSRWHWLLTLVRRR